MAKLIAITLLQTCIIGGLPRSPVEGVQMVSEDDAERLVESKMAELADVDDSDAADEEEIDGDGLEQTKVVDLRKVAKDEGVTIEGDANKAAIVAAIRAHREKPSAPTPLDGLDEAQLRQVAADESVILVEDVAELDVPGILAAIEAKRALSA